MTKYRLDYATKIKEAKPLIVPVSTALLALSIAYFYGKSKGQISIFVADRPDGSIGVTHSKM